MIPINCTGDDIAGGPSAEPSDWFSFSGVTGESGGWASSKCKSGRAEVISIVDPWSRELGRADVGKAGEGGCSNESGVATIPRDELALAFEGRLRLQSFRLQGDGSCSCELMTKRSRG